MKHYVDEESLLFGTREPIGGGLEWVAPVDADQSVVESPKQVALEEVGLACAKTGPSIS